MAELMLQQTNHERKLQSEHDVSRKYNGRLKRFQKEWNPGDREKARKAIE
jgi:hypothetical protein